MAAELLEFPHEVRGVRATRLDLQFLRARKIKSGARHARGAVVRKRPEPHRSRSRHVVPRHLFADGAASRGPRTDADGRYYQVCLACGTAYEYDWEAMRRTGRVLIEHAQQG